MLALCTVAVTVATLNHQLAPQVGFLIAAITLAGFLVAIKYLGRELTGLQRYLEKLRKAETRRQQELRDLLVVCPPSRCSDVDFYVDLGGRRSQLAEQLATESAPGGVRRPAYVPRLSDVKLRSHLKDHTPFVLVYGESRAGKSRTAYEALLAPDVGLADHVLVIPDRNGLKADSLGSIFDKIASAELGSRPALLWLDDLHHYLEAGAITPKLLNRLRQENVMVIATIRNERYNALLFPSQAARGGGKKSVDSGRELKVETLDPGAVLDQAVRVEVECELSGEELEAASRLYPGHNWANKCFGGELVLVSRLIDKVSTATVIQADLLWTAVDWERAGATRPITKDELKRLWRIYAEHRRPRSASGAEFEDALRWATERIDGSETALVYANATGFEADNALIAYRESRHSDVPQTTWDWIIKGGTASPAELFGVGLAAFGRGNLDHAVAAWEYAQTATDPLVAAMALRNKGVTLGELGRSEEAIEAYDQVVERFGSDPEPGLREHVATALFNKGVTLGQLGRSEEAVAVYNQVVERFGGDSEPGLREQVAKALFNTGLSLGQLRRGAEEAVAVYDQVVERFGGDPEPGVREQVATALFYKGLTLGQLGRSEEAVAVYNQVVERFGGDPGSGLREQVAEALINKAITLGELERSEEAVAAYEEVEWRFAQVQEHSVQGQLARALFNRAVVFAQQGRPEQAIAAFEEVERRLAAQEWVLQMQVARALFNNVVAISRGLPPRSVPKHAWLWLHTPSYP